MLFCHKLLNATSCNINIIHDFDNKSIKHILQNIALFIITFKLSWKHTKIFAILVKYLQSQWMHIIKLARNSAIQSQPNRS